MPNNYRSDRFLIVNTSEDDIITVLTNCVDGPERDVPRVEGERHRTERQDCARVLGKELQRGECGHRGAHCQAGHQGQAFLCSVADLNRHESVLKSSFCILMQK